MDRYKKRYWKKKLAKWNYKKKLLSKHYWWARAVASSCTGKHENGIDKSSAKWSKGCLQQHTQ